MFQLVYVAVKNWKHSQRWRVFFVWNSVGILCQKRFPAVAGGNGSLSKDGPLETGEREEMMWQNAGGLFHPKSRYLGSMFNPNLLDFNLLFKDICLSIILDLRLYKNILVDYVVYHFLRYRAKKVVLDHIDWFFLNRPVMGQMGPYETFSTWSQESQCWEIKFDDLGILLDSLAIDHLLDWDNHLITTMILEYGIDWDNHWQSPSHFLGPLAT